MARTTVAVALLLLLALVLAAVQAQERYGYGEEEGTGEYGRRRWRGGEAEGYERERERGEEDGPRWRGREAEEYDQRERERGEEYGRRWRGREEEGYDQREREREAFLLRVEKQVVRTDAGAMRVVRGFNDWVINHRPIHIGFITMEPKSLFVPQYIDADLILFVHRGGAKNSAFLFLFFLKLKSVSVLMELWYSGFGCFRGSHDWVYLQRRGGGETPEDRRRVPDSGGFCVLLGERRRRTETSCYL